MAVGLSCGAEQDEGCFSGRHPSMFAFCSHNNKENVVAAAREIGVGLGSTRDIPTPIGFVRNRGLNRIGRPIIGLGRTGPDSEVSRAPTRPLFFVRGRLKGDHDGSLPLCVELTVEALKPGLFA